MPASKADIIAQLQKEILPLQGFKHSLNRTSLDMGLGKINESFPNSIFPLGAVHEFLSECSEDAAATGGFMAGLLSALMRDGGATLWISSSRTLFPPALKFFGIDPDKIIFIDLQKEKDVLWAMEEALQCEGLSAVVGEIRELSFTASRRLQLVVEQSRVTGFILRRNTRNLNTSACLTRWKITAAPSELTDEMPGIGFPRWNVELLKVRNGKPGSWQVEWTEGRFRHIPILSAIMEEEQKKAG